MATPREGPNPLRPYYIPPSVGPPPGVSSNGTSTSNMGSGHPSTSTSSFGSSARNILADMDYSDYISDPSPSATAMGKNLVEQAIWKYTSVFLAQPFEVAKTVLQVQVTSSNRNTGTKKGQDENVRRQPGNHRRTSYEPCDVLYLIIRTRPY